MKPATKREYEALLKLKTWPKRDIQRTTNALNRVRWSKDDGFKAFMVAFLEAFNDGMLERTITSEHSAQGIAYMLKYVWTTKGEVRKSCKLGAAERMILKNFKRFSFIGWHIEYNGLGMEFYHIAYRVHAKNGSYFDYSPVYWGDPLVLDTHLTGGKVI